MSARHPERGASRYGSFLRHWLWRGVWRVAGGLKVSGTAPAGPAVLVANHTSHADTAALLAALPSSRRPVLAAAADYWFSSQWRRIAVTSVVSVIPLYRSANGAYAALLDAARPPIVDGAVVIVFPEGTRSIDGRIGPFHGGAIRLARDLGAPLVPVAIIGTDAVFPKHGRIRRGRVTVRFGTPIQPTGLPADRDGVRGLAEQVRATVITLRDGADLPPEGVSR